MRDFGMGDFFGDMVGGGGGGGRRRGRNLQVVLKLSLREAAQGATKKVKLQKQVPCDDCHGSGAAPGSPPETCPHAAARAACARCGRRCWAAWSPRRPAPVRGEGRIVQNPCRSCNGTGTVRGEETLEIKVPAGVTGGNYMEIQGKGDAGEHGAAPATCA